MQFKTSFSMAALALAAAVNADFQIYKTMGRDVLGADWDSWMVFDGEPSCNDVNNNYRSLGNFGDVSGTPGIRCDGCGEQRDIREPGWDIAELEINGAGWGHYTIYKDSGYQLTPRDGGDLRGSCVQDTGADFMCAGAVASSGIRMFRCTSDLGGIRAR